MRFGKIETLEAELARIDNSNVAIIEQEMPGILDNPDLFFPVMTMMSKARGDEYRFHTSTTKQLTEVFMIYGYEGNPPEWDYNYKEREQAEEQEENIHYQQLTNGVKDEKID